MGKDLSKSRSLEHGQEPVTGYKTNDDKKISWEIKRSTYVFLPGRNSQMEPDQTGLPKGTVKDRTMQTQGKKRNTYVGYEGTQINTKNTVDDTRESTEDVKDNPQYENTEPEDISTSADSSEHRVSATYVNLPFVIDMGRIPNDTTLGSPDSVEALSLRRHYRELKDRVLLESVCDHLIQDDVLSDLDYEKIMDGPYIRRLRIDILLQIILRQKKKKVFEAFISALRKTECQDLADKLENTKGIALKKPYVRDWTSNFILNAWPQIETYLLAELRPEYILDFFMQENIFNVDEYEEVFWTMGKRMEMRKTFLAKIKNHLPDAFFVLLYALEEINTRNENIAAELENLVAAGKDQGDASGKCEKETDTGVHLLRGSNATLSVTEPVSVNPVRAAKLSVMREDNVIENVEIEINKSINNTETACLLDIFLPLTGSDETKLERGCVTLHFRPHSKNAYDKFSKFCRNGELENSVLNLMREKDIFASLPAGELCFNIHVQYDVEEMEAKADEEPEIDLTDSIRDNWSFLCEEMDVHNLIRSSINNTLFTVKEVNELEKRELEGRTANDRHEVADNFLRCLLEKGQAGINFLMDVLREKNDMKILNRLQKSRPLDQNPQAVKENIIVYFESIIEEIDTTQFQDTFIERNILDNAFFTDVRENHPRRRSRAALFLREVLNKGNNAIVAFLDVLADMGYDELLKKLVPPEDNLLESKQQNKDEMKNDTVKKASNGSSPKGFIWSSCLKINVEKKEND